MVWRLPIYLLPCLSIRSSPRFCEEPFVLSVFLLSITPGPDMAYVVGQSIANGRRAGVISAAGVALGSCTHALFSIAGLTALIAASPCSRW